MITLEEAKQYLRLDLESNDEDLVLQLMIDNAELYIEDAVGSIPTANEKAMKKAKLLSMILVADFYENREISKKTSDKLAYTVRSILIQLEYLLGGDCIESW